MKKIVSITLVLSLMISGLQSRSLKGFTPSPDGIKVSSTVKDDKVVVEYSGLDNDQVQVKLFDRSGTLLDSQTLTKLHPSHEFSKLTHGIYWMSIKKSDKVSFERLIIS